MPIGKVSGRLVVAVVFLGAILLATVLFMVGYRHKLNLESQRRESGGNWEKAASPDAIRTWMSRLPKEWVKVTYEPGRGFVRLVPCYSPNSLLTLTTALDSLPGVNCEECDSLSDRQVREIRRNPADSALHFSLLPDRGTIKVLPVDAALTAKFAGAPFHDKILLWIVPKAGTPVSAAGEPTPPGGMAEDTLIFAPQSQEAEFEVLRAEDENAEGCGPESDPE